MKPQRHLKFPSKVVTSVITSCFFKYNTLLSDGKWLINGTGEEAKLVYEIWLENKSRQTVEAIKLYAQNSVDCTILKQLFFINRKPLS